MKPVFVRWKCSGCDETNMVSVPSGYVWEKELACRSCHKVFSDAASPAYQIPINLSSDIKPDAHHASRQRH
jgi:hypothetical protein